MSKIRHHPGGAASHSAACRRPYDGVNLIVRDLNLDIRRGEFLTLLGPSGSGKTTYLMMLAGFETPATGDIRLGREVINRVPPHKRNIGMVFRTTRCFRT